MSALRDLELAVKQLGRRIVRQEQVGAEQRIFNLESAINPLLYHHETFESLEPTLAEDIVLVLPSSMATLVLDLRGRALRGGLVAVHNHSASVSVTVNGTDLGTVTAANDSTTHTHTTSDATPTDATPTTDGSHDHDLRANTDPGTPKALTATGVASTQVAGFLYAAGGHTHGAHGHGAHNHGATAAGASTHGHGVTLGSHGHTASGTGSTGNAGAGGAVAASRPAGVTLTIDGIDRTVALGGAWGAAGADWNATDLNILQYLQGTIPGSHTLVLGCTGIGRLKATVRGVVA